MRVCTVLAVFAACVGVLAQDRVLVSADKVGSLSRAQAREAIQGLPLAGTTAPDPQAWIDWYRVKYRSIDVEGKSVVLSGLIAVPLQKSPQGYAVYMHGTSADKNAVPSRIAPNYIASNEGWAAMLLIATGGYVLAAPDYIGLGDGPGVHPYPSGPLNAPSGVDVLRAAKELMADLHRKPGSKLVVAGYSEGGLNAAWLTRILQDHPDPSMRPTAAAPMAGPYDLMGAQMRSILSRRVNVLDVAARVFLISFTGNSLAYATKDAPIGDIFIPAFASKVEELFKTGYVENEALAKELYLAAAKSDPFWAGAVLTSKFRDAIRTNDTTNPAVKRLLDSVILDWTPKAPLLFLGLANDNVVVFENTKVALRALRAKGIGPDRVRAWPLPNRGLNHLDGHAVALVAARQFFDGGFGAVPTLPDP